jgi:hypothetical protein
MTFAQALKFYKTQKAIAEALCLSNARVSQCKSEGGFSYPLQCVLEKDSGGALVAKRKDEPNQKYKAA